MTQVLLEEETPYVKSSRKPTPPKANHKHEYFRYVAWNRIRRFDGSITTEKYKFSLPAMCIDCGHIHRKAYSTAVEIEVSPKEFRRLKNGSTDV